MNTIDKALEWQLPVPRNYFDGIKLSKLSLADNVVLFRRSSFAELTKRRFENRPHHRFVLLLNLQTIGSVNVDGDSYRIHPGHAFLIAPFQLHFYVDCESESLAWLFLTFESDNRDLFSELINRPVWVDNEGWRLLETVVETYLELASNSDRLNLETNIWVLQCNRLLQHLLAQASKTQPKPVKIHAKHPTTDHYLRVLNQLLESEADIRSIQELAARRLSISESHLRRQFKSCTGLSMGQYLIHYRMNRAIKMLVHTDTPVSEIAEIAGYDSIAAFSRAFKKRLHLPPSAYRKTLKL